MKVLLVALVLSATGQKVGTPVEFDVSARKVTATGSTTARALKDRFSDVVNVKDFGAKGDGVTDDTAAIQAAISAATAKGGGEVRVPAGTYQIGAAGLTWSPEVHLVGDGIGATILKSTTANTLIHYTPGTLVDHNGSIRSLSLDGNSIGTVGLDLARTARFLLEDVDVHHFTTQAVRMAGVLIWRAKRLVAANSVIGLSCVTDSAIQCNLIKLELCRFQANSTYGATFSGGGTVAIEAAEFGSNGTAGNAATGGLKISGQSGGYRISDGYFEDNSGHSAIRVDSTSYVVGMVSVRDSYIVGGNRTYGFYASGAGVKYELDNVSAQNAATSDIADDSTIDLGFRRGCVAGTSAAGTRTTELPVSTSSHITGLFEFRNPVKPKQLIGTRVVLSHPGAGATLGIDAASGNHFDLVLGSPSAFTIGNPSNPNNTHVGQRITLRIANSSGNVLGAITWGSAYKMASWVSPANGYSRSIDFQYDGTNWNEIARALRDAPIASQPASTLISQSELPAPVGGWAQDLIVNGSALDQSPWETTNATVTANADGAADQITVTNTVHSVRQLIQVTPGASYKFAFDAKNHGGTAAKYSVYAYQAGTPGNIVAPTSYWSSLNDATYTAISVPFTAPADCTGVLVYVVRDSGTGVDLYVKNVKVTPAATAMPAQADSVAVDVPGLKTDFNALLSKLRSAGLMAP